MEYVKDLKWKQGINVRDFVDMLGKTGFQSVELVRASDIIVKMKKVGAKIFFTFTSNMVTSGLRGFFAQCIKLGMANAVVTTTGAIEEDIMRSLGERFVIASFNSDDIKLHEQGMNRVGNLLISNESYARFEDFIGPVLDELNKKKHRYSVTELLYEIGSRLNDEDSFLYQAAKNNVPVFAPAITDGSLGFHLYFAQQKYKDFVIDVIKDFEQLILSINQDDKKGLIALGGGVSKHHAILAALINGGLDYAIYISTARETSGSMSGATTNEAKSWGKIKEDSEAVTVVGDVTVFFPLVMIHALETLKQEGFLNG